MSDSGHVGPTGGDDRAASSDRSSQLGSARPGGAGRGPDRPGDRRTSRLPPTEAAGAGGELQPRAGAGRPDAHDEADANQRVGEGAPASKDGSGSRTSAPDPRTEVADHAGRSEASPTPFTQQVGRIALALLAVLFGVFAVANSQRVDFSWVFGATEVRRDSAGDIVGGGVPLIVLLVVSLVIGIAVGMLTTWLMRRRRR